MTKFGDLRRRAQQRLVRPTTPEELSKLSVYSVANLIEELRIHQAELEMQNEDLRRSQHEAERSRQRYKTLFDLAPVGYFILDPNGLILDVNETGANQLGLPRQRLRSHTFTTYVDSASQDAFYLHRQAVLTGEARQRLTLKLVKADGTPFEAELESVCIEDEDENGERREIQSALIDLTERNQLQAALSEERNLLRTLIDHLPAYVYVKDRDSRFILGNRAVAEVMSAASPEALIGQTDSDFYPELLADRYYANDQTVIRSGEPLIDVTEPLIDPAGRRRWLATTKVPLRNAAGQVIGLVGIGRDVTEQSRSKNRMHLLHALTEDIGQAPTFEAALSKTLDTICEVTHWDYGEAWLLDETRQVLRCSPAWCGNRDTWQQFRALSEVLTFAKGDGLPGRAWATEEPEWLADFSQNAPSYFVRRRLALAAGFNSALVVPALANHRVVVILLFFMAETRPENEEMVDLVSTVAGQLSLVLHRRKVQEEREQLVTTLDRQREDLRALAGRLAEIQEAERQQLAAELHDQVGQNLTALGFNLDALLAWLAETSTGAGPVQERLDDSLALLEQTTDRIRDLMAELRPPMLDEYGLVEALEWYAERFTGRTGLPVEIEDGILAERLTGPVETALFRIVQEALTNAAKYAQASWVTIIVKEEEEVVHLEVVDDGLGFDPQQVAKDKQRQNLGLLTMRERALAVGGRCWVESQPGRGTRVIAEVPR